MGRKHLRFVNARDLQQITCNWCGKARLHWVGDDPKGWIILQRKAFCCTDHRIKCAIERDRIKGGIS